MTSIPDTPVLLAFTLAGFVLFITPGPDMSLFLAKTVAGGRRAGIAAYIGASLGCIVHSLLAALGISALLAASPAAFLALKVVGAAYLLWLAVDAVRNGSSLNVRARHTRASAAFWPTLLLGLGVNMTNPKVVLFFVTFLPQFIHAGDTNAPGKLFFLGLELMAVLLPVALLVVWSADWLAKALTQSRRVQRALNWGFAGVFTTFAAVILSAQARHA